MPGGTKLEEKYLQMKKKKYDAIYALYAFFHKILTEVEKKIIMPYICLEVDYQSTEQTSQLHKGHSIIQKQQRKTENRHK